MSNPKTSVLEELEKIIEFLEEDIFNSSDEEILADEDANGIGVDKVVSKSKAILQNAQKQLGSRQLARAKLSIGSSIESSKKTMVSEEEAVKTFERLQKLRSLNDNSTPKLTLAAREGAEQTDAEKADIISDLKELGLDLDEL